jgi:hypothetical protein
VVGYSGFSIPLTNEKLLQDIIKYGLIESYEDAKKLHKDYPFNFSKKDVKALKRVAKYYGAVFDE